MNPKVHSSPLLASASLTMAMSSTFDESVVSQLVQLGYDRADCLNASKDVSNYKDINAVKDKVEQKQTIEEEQPSKRQKPFKCEICNLSFEISDWNKHIADVHERKKTFIVSGKIREKQRILEGKPSKSFKCECI